MRAPRLDTHHVDLAGFEAWLRGQLVGPAFSAVIVVVVQMIRALFQQNTELRARIQGRRSKPPRWLCNSTKNLPCTCRAMSCWRARRE